MNPFTLSMHRRLRLKTTFVVLIYLVTFRPVYLEAQSILDSLEIWKKDYNLRALSNRADQLLAGNTAKATACEQAEFLVEASIYAVDLFEPDKSLRYAQQAHQIRCSNQALRMKALMREAIAYNMLERIDSAILLTQQVLQYAEKAKNTELMCNGYSNLGMMLNKQHEYNEALASFKRAHELIQANATDRQRAISFFNLSLCYFHLNDLDKGIHTVDSAIILASKANIRALMAQSYGLKAELIKGKKDIPRWLTVMDTAINIALQIGNPAQAAAGFNDKCEYYLSINEFFTALQYGEKANSMLLNSKKYPLLRKNYKHLYEAYRATGNMEKALYNLEQYTSLKDSLDNITFQQQIHELNLKYEVAEKENRIFEQKTELHKSRLYLVIALGGIFFLFWRNRINRQTIKKSFQKELALETSLKQIRLLVPTNSANSTIVDNIEVSLLLHRLIDLMENQKVYLNPKLSRNDILTELGTNRTYFSQIFSKIHPDGLRSYINQYRINHAKDLVWKITSEKIDLSLNMVWEASGYASKEVFYRSFKAATNLTFREYVEQVSLELKKPNTSHNSDESDL